MKNSTEKSVKTTTQTKISSAKDDFSPQSLKKESFNYFDSRLEKLKQSLNLGGNLVLDKRFGRAVMRQGGIAWVVGITQDTRNYDVWEYLSKQKPLPKYRKDWKRMEKTFNALIKEYKKDEDSRRLVILNTDDFLKVYPCFLSIQLVKSESGDFSMIVYQRSQDLEKMHDDLVFFFDIMKKIKKHGGPEIKKFLGFYGDSHYEVQGYSHVE